MTSKQIHLNFSKTSLTGADLWPWHTACALFFTELSRRKALDRGWTRFQHYWYTICNFCQSFSTFVNFSNLLSTLASIWRLLTTFFWRMMRIWAVWLSEGNCLTRGDWLAADVAPAASRYSQHSTIHSLVQRIRLNHYYVLRQSGVWRLRCGPAVVTDPLDTAMHYQGSTPDE